MFQNSLDRLKKVVTRKQEEAEPEGLPEGFLTALKKAVSPARVTVEASSMESYAWDNTG
ncbi:MAG: hypothetical protein HQL50_13025, partial [Magnetococcales bacterium]|nr:hypothetical protein [Magnetococcales bacterium]